MTQIVPTKTRLDQAAELINQLSLDEIKQLFQLVPVLNRYFDENKVAQQEKNIAGNAVAEPKTQKIQLGLLQDKKIVIHDDFAMTAEEFLNL